jgi:hypothetical protein
MTHDPMRQADIARRLANLTPMWGKDPRWSPLPAEGL